MTQNRKTNNRQRIGITPRRRRGGQPGNQNAAKPLPTLSRTVRDLKRRIRKALKKVPRPRRRRLACV
jgi:hypothetical protein